MSLTTIFYHSIYPIFTLKDKKLKDTNPMFPLGCIDSAADRRKGHRAAPSQWRGLLSCDVTPSQPMARVGDSLTGDEASPHAILPHLPSAVPYTPTSPL